MANEQMRPEPVDEAGRDMAIQRIRLFAPNDGYYVAISGGKDSTCLYHLVKMSGVKADYHYNLTTVDPPELVRFIRDEMPDVKIEHPRETMWQLIVRKRMPPTRLVRYCCAELKERGGEGRTVLTGIRWAESPARAKRGMAEEIAKSKLSERCVIMNDNEAERKMSEFCGISRKKVVNPIIDWSDDDVWGFIRGNGFAYCRLYDEGFARLGCVGCPLAKKANRLRELERWPKIKAAYIRAFQRCVDKRIADGLKTDWRTGQDMFDWWVFAGRKAPKHYGAGEVE